MFGQSELALRLPNVVAFGIYGTASVVLLSQAHHFEAKAMGFALLVANPFLLEFFRPRPRLWAQLGLFGRAAACVVFARGMLSARRELSRIVLIGVFGRWRSTPISVR